MRPPYPNKGYWIYCDGNSVGITAVLMQRDDNQTRKLTPAERRYSTTEVELLAIVYSLKKFHQYVYLKEIDVFSDHIPLVWLNSLLKHSNRLMRWVILLQDYNLKVNDIPGQRQMFYCKFLDESSGERMSGCFLTHNIEMFYHYVISLTALF